MKWTFLVVFLLCAALAFPQGSSTATLGGSITDPTGAAVPGADVTLINTATGAALKTTSSERGEFAFPQIAGGQYRVTITKTGFRSATVDNITMEAGVPATVPVKLEIGQATETVVVTAGAEVVQSTS